MKYPKACAFSALFCLLSGPISAKKYPVVTGNDQITCQIQTYTKHQMMLLIGSMLFPTHIKHMKNHFFSDVVEIYYTKHPMDTLPKDYIVTKVYIENNSSEPVYLAGKYLSGTQEFFISKQQFLEDHLSKHLDRKREKPWAILLLTVPFLLPLLTEILLFSRIELTGEDRTAIKKFMRFWLVSCSLTGSISYFWLKNINKLKKIYNKIINKTFYSTEESDLCHRYKLESPYYEVPPKTKFQDIFFVSGVDRNVFAETYLKLLYSTKPPETKI